MANIEGGIKRKSRLAVFEHVVEKKKKPENKRFHTNRQEDADSSPSDSELVIDDEKEPVKKKRIPFVKLSEEPLSLRCEWNDCNEKFTSWQKFNTHLADHATVASENLVCQWNSCGLTSSSFNLLMQHVSFHGYITKLKNIGHNVLFRNNLPKCTEKGQYTVPVLSNGYSCHWECCTFTGLTIYDFLTHVETHVMKNPRISSESNPIVCSWAGCTHTKYANRYKLAEHVRTHTKEKTIACPTCCTQLSCKTKFYDHRKRQLSTDLQSYQCSQCLKLFPSERLLRDHMRSHINHYKCTMCDMTCPKPSVLAKHIRFKHVRHKPYKCTHEQCTKTFVAKHNLDTHLKTHKEQELMRCDQCDFTCRSKRGLISHYPKAHEKQRPLYQCHCCKKKLKRGSYLTKHLMKVHNYHWPSGHSRFRYRKDQDGIYRLQTVRYESLEVTQEMIKSESGHPNNVVKEVRYSLRYDTDRESNYVLSVLENEEPKVVKVDPDRNKILITIDDVDEQGNILKSEVVQSTLESPVVVTENALSDVTIVAADQPVAASGSVGKVADKRRKSQRLKRKPSRSKTDAIKKECDETDEDKHYFSEEVIFNTPNFVLEQPKADPNIYILGV